MADAFLSSRVFRLPVPVLFSFFFISFCMPSSAQQKADTATLKAVYDRCLDFDESRIDSIEYYAAYIERQSKQLHFAKGDVLSLRLRGLAEEFRDDYSKAAEYYLLSLEAARKLNEPAYEISALSDLAILYANIDQPGLARNYYLQCMELSLKQGDLYSILTSYNNLGVIYSQLNEYDSALVYLEKALVITAQQSPPLDQSNTLNNIGSCYFKKKEFGTALGYFSRNYLRHARDTSALTSLWTDQLNLADTYIELKNYARAQVMADSALLLAQRLGSKSKESDSYSILAKLHAALGKYDKAYAYLQQWYALDTALINGSTQQAIAGLQEKFNARKREAENRLLLSEVEKEKFRLRSLTYVILGLTIAGFLVVVAFLIKRKANRELQAQNELISRQNSRLEELNDEKNALISIVSHDLGTPFATIQMWSELLRSDAEALTAEQQKAVQRIMQASTNGEALIRRILDIERDQIGNYRLQLELVDVTQLIAGIVEGFRKMAEKKQIRLAYQHPSLPVELLTDRQLLQRVAENLISNALKYTPGGKAVLISLENEPDALLFTVADEGVGIAPDEIPLLFTKYSKISSQPTGGESSTGLGLAIVKRILTELNGTISCTSTPGEGTIFATRLKK